MFPYLDSVSTRSPPIIVWALIGMNAIAFLYQIGLPTEALMPFLNEYALVPAHFFGQADPDTPRHWTAFLTNIFLHGGWLHLLLNMWTLWIFGPAVEDRLGPVRFLVFYLACGVLAGLAHALAHPASTVPALGASGAIAGVIGSYARMFPAARLLLIVPIFIFPLFVEVRAIVFAMIWLLMQIIPGFLSLGQEAAGGIAWWAHIGGFMAGWLLTPLTRRPVAAHHRYYRGGPHGFLPDAPRSGRRRHMRDPWP